MTTAKDLTGQRFGKLTVLERAEKPKNVKRGVYWLCQCDCGNKKVVLANSLKNGDTKSCGCVKRGPKSEDIAGKRFGKLTAIEMAYRKGKTPYWRCICDCGNEKITSLFNLRNGDTKSCGCLYMENLIGKRFGRLLVKAESDKKDKKNNRYWVCICDCGNECIYSTSKLKSGEVISCGCRKKEAQKEFGNRTAKEYAIDGTHINSIQLMDKTRSNNTTGCTGVRWHGAGNGRWIATIEFKKHRYHLGCFKNYEDAVAARKEAEEQTHGLFLKWYAKEYPESFNKTNKANKAKASKEDGNGID